MGAGGQEAQNDQEDRETNRLLHRADLRQFHCSGVPTVAGRGNIGSVSGPFGPEAPPLVLLEKIEHVLDSA